MSLEATVPLIIKQTRALGITAVIAAGDTWENSAIIENTGNYAEGAVFSTFFDESETANDEAAGSTDTTAIRDALQTISPDGTTSTISFDENGDAKKDIAFIKTIQDGTFKFLTTITIQ